MSSVVISKLELFFGNANMNPPDTKICSKCGVEKLVSEMHGRKNRKTTGFICKDCNRELNRQRAKNRKIMGDPPKGYRCPVCNKNEEEISSGSDANTVWNLDHDHTTKAIRTWLCHNCNRGLGTFHDNVEWLANAIEYINEYTGKQ